MYCVKMRFLHLLAFLSVLGASKSQNCPRITMRDLGRIHPSPNGLIPTRLAEDSGGFRPNIQLIGFHIVCEVTDGNVDRYRHVSLVAEYVNNGTNISSQFEFSCEEEDDWDIRVNGSTENTITTPPDANFSTPLRRDCYMCLSPSRNSATTDPINHCAGMAIY